jgi:hypothetical protein
MMNPQALENSKPILDIISSKLICAGVVFLVTIMTGIVLSSSGRRFSIGMVTVHKLVAVAAMVLVGMSIKQGSEAIGGLAVVETGLVVVSAILCLGLIATGALLTREELYLPEWILSIHKLAPPAALVTSTAALYMLTRGQT